ncbi:MAG: LytR C-terminal domain-containing protein [bacterium]
MNRVPLRETGRKPSEHLERRVNLLTILVGIQVILLVVLLILDFAPRLRIGGGGEGRISPEQMAENPTVDMPERGDLPPEVEPTRPVRVEILNGCGISRLASRFAEVLRAKGYDVRDTRNADHLNYSKSLIYDRTNLQGQALRIAQFLSIPADRVLDRPNPQLVDIDLTLILGKDYATLTTDH